MDELRAYKPDLARRPQIVVLSKIDGLSKNRLDSQIKTAISALPKKTPLLAISSRSGEGLIELKRLLLGAIAAANKKPAKTKSKTRLPVIGLKPADNWHISVTDNGFIVTGTQIERFAQRTRFGDYYGEQRLRDILTRKGIIRDLTVRGLKPGQKIIIGKPPIGHLVY